LLNENIYKQANAKTHTFCNSASSLIKRLRIISDKGGELEDIINYNQTHAMCADLVLDIPNRWCRVEAGFGNTGYTQEIIARPAVIAPAVPTDTASLIAEVAKIKTALLAPQPASAWGSDYVGCNEAVITQNGLHTFCIPLELSSLVGSASEKLVPLMLMGSLIMEIELNPTCCMVNDNALPTFAVSDVEYHAQIIEFSSDVNQALTSMASSSGLYIHGTQWKAIYSSLASGVKNIVISERLKSLKSLFLTFNKPPADLANTRSTARDNHELTSFQVRAGAEYFPVHAIKGTANDKTKNGEFIVETFKAISQYANSQHSCILNSENFATNENVADRCSRSVFGIDMDAFCKDASESGLNTIENSPIDVRFDTVNADVVDSYVHLLFDVIYVISPDGQVSVSK
jgi:hypothetical protein